MKQFFSFKKVTKETLEKDDNYKLPAIVCLKSDYNNKYLCYHYEDLKTHGLPRFSSDKVVDPLAQFEVVWATIGGGLIHLKSRCTNKYLVRWSPNHYWISASADKPNEDQTDWSCTLFKPSYILDGFTEKARFMHVQLGHYASLWKIDDVFNSCLFAGSKDIDRESCDIVTVIDWSSTHILPKNVAFKGDNGKYLGAYIDNGLPYLQFSFDDPKDPKVAQEVYTSDDGIILIKSKYYDRFWRLGEEDYIVADVIGPGSSHASAMFRAKVVDFNVVGLLNMSKTWYVKRYTQTDTKDSLLNAIAESMDKYSLLHVEDLGQ